MLFKVYENFIDTNDIKELYNEIKNNLNIFTYKNKFDSISYRVNVENTDKDIYKKTPKKILFLIENITKKVSELYSIQYLKRYNFSLYKKNMYYECHRDTLENNSLSVLLYLIHPDLNWTIEDGGFTIFYLNDFLNNTVILPVTGTAVIFDARILHQATMVNNKEKLILNLLYKTNE